MERLINFIHNWLGSNSFELLTDEKIKELMSSIDDFIKINYPLIENDTYVKITFDDHQNPHIGIDKKLVEQLEQFYPESLI